ncbi:response receiver chemotaxis protein-glutamate methylesterase CheB [Candidatus Moduliflexus flocculans]|uniref:Protein-glutamate methylesterase/protein-glutamine glutaminase n=1 Tax=Candidatus Moduliflexus flocculans TaxID=1499966 RepID=A0A0S6VRC3_9BACT|nr:response receiver chemotaxis protein-glutamate methylesterase CheB [Candidatus Moduliflexus flocculans]
MLKKPPVKVVIVDDSALMRQTLKTVLSTDPEVEVIATAPDPLIAAKKMEKEMPDVLMLDIEMPRMDGLTFLQKIMSEHPIPVVICSALSEEGSEVSLKAMEYGAVDIIQKPRERTKEFLEEYSVRICDIVKAAAESRAKKVIKIREVEPKLTADVVLAKPTRNTMIQTTEKIVVVGASTGGTEALREFLEAMPWNAPGIVIVQHMPEHFTKAFAKRLDGLCKITVKEAENNDSVIPSRALIAPGNKHTLIRRSGTKYYVEVTDGPLVCRHRPSVDVLFRSAARYAGRNAIGVIMTGMGDDGARGMLEMKEAGAAMNIAQDETTSVVFGMPNEAIKRGAVDKILPLGEIAKAVIDAVSK